MTSVDALGLDNCNLNGAHVDGVVACPIQSYYGADYNTNIQPVPDWHYFQGQTWQSVDSWLAKPKQTGTLPDGTKEFIDGYTDYNPLPTGLLNGFTASDKGPGYHGGDATAIPGWYNDLVYKQYWPDESALLKQLGYEKQEYVGLTPVGTLLVPTYHLYTNWTDFFKDRGIGYGSPGFPSTTTPTAQHPNACSELQSAVARYENMGLLPPPNLLMLMKQKCQ